MKIYKELVAIKLKDWRIVTTTLSMNEVAKLLNENDFVMIWDVWFSKYEVKYFDKFTPTEIENFIFSQPKEIARELEKIYRERELKWLETSWTKHLREIYENRLKK